MVDCSNHNVLHYVLCGCEKIDNITMLKNKEAQKKEGIEMVMEEMRKNIERLREQLTPFRPVRVKRPRIDDDKGPQRGCYISY